MPRAETVSRCDWSAAQAAGFGVPIAWHLVSALAEARDASLGAVFAQSPSRLVPLPDSPDVDISSIHP